jgi:hypothetical protein
MATFTFVPTPSEDRFWRVCEGIRADVSAAIKANRTYLTIYNVKAANQDIQQKISRYPEVWTTILYSLQSTFFIAFGRLFDKRGDSLSVTKLLEITIKNVQIFSKAQLLRRKRFDSRIEGDDPLWLTEYIARAWEPTGDDLKRLLRALAPHCDKFKQVYAPIRHEIYAHRSKKNEEDVYAHFGKTLIGDVEQILAFIYTLIVALRELAANGRRPDLADVTEYRDFVRKIDAEVENFVRQLV